MDLSTANFLTLGMIKLREHNTTKFDKTTDSLRLRVMHFFHIHHTKRNFTF